ncbi:MAG TPA: AMP-binding protein [Candidatus Dormibacteraeota bacterium]
MTTTLGRATAPPAATSPSYANGPSRAPLLGTTIGDNLRAVARAHAGAAALVARHQDVRLSYAELDAAVDRVALALIGLGLHKGDRLGIWSPNRFEWVVLQYATARAGVVLVNINPAYCVEELGYSLRQSGVRALVTAAAFKGADYLDMLAACNPPSSLEHVVVLGAAPRAGQLSWDDLERRGADADRETLTAREATLDPDDAINIQYTSGTTGSPKGATLSHHSILNNGFFVGEALRLTPADRLCIPVPFYHCFGMVLGNLACTTHGATMVLPGEAFDPLAVLETVAAERCTALHGVPTMFIAELDHPRFAEFDLTSLRTGIMAGSPCPVEVMRQVVARMHMTEVTICYGMTETSPVSTQSLPDDDVERRCTSVGQVHPHVEVKIVDPDGGRMQPRGVAGELCTRGYSVMLGYWDNPQATAAAIDGARWMHTGDLATMDADGYVNIVGRIKDLVIRGGENVYPREVEEFLHTHPAISEAQVVGVPDARYGEELCACVRVRPGMTVDPEEVRDFCRGRIAHFKVPRYVVLVDEFPMTVTGKVQKYLLRQRMTAQLGLAEAVPTA